MSQPHAAHDELDAETQSANADVLSETLPDDGRDARHTDTEPQSADSRRSETQAVDDVTVSVRSLLRLDGNVVPWGDRDADDEIRWTDECADDVDDETRSKSDDDGREMSNDAGLCSSDIKADDLLARYYTANHKTSDERQDDSATGGHDVITVRRCYSMTASVQRATQSSTRGGVCLGHGRHRIVRVRGSTGIEIINGKAEIPAC